MSRNAVFSLHGLLLSLLLASPLANALTSAELERMQYSAARVTIIRDDFGVPHIYGKTDADAVFGMLYAQSEDDFNRVEQNYIWATGRLAEVEGEQALYSDLRARLYMTNAQARAAYEAAPKWLQELCIAFADGINYYLYTHPQVRPRLLTHFEPWMPMFFSEGSIGGDIEWIPLQGIKAFYGEGKSVNELALTAQRRRELAEPVGSNGFAISGKRTRSGNAMLLINPHTSFFFRGELHVVSEQGLNAYGAVTWGQFFVYQGFNENTGWMHTSTGVDFIDEFVEDIVKVEGELLYRYGEELRPVRREEVTLKYKDGDKLSARSFPMYFTHHGPVTHKLGDKWVVTKINWDPVNALRQSFTRTKLANYGEFRQMMDIRTNSSNNTVFADSSGNIAYFHGNFVPRRNPAFDFSKPVDGSNPETDWLGLHSVDEIVTLHNPSNGWIQNCNSTPFTAAAEQSPRRENYLKYMAPDAENFRGVHAVRVLSDAEDLTLDKLIELAHDPVLPAFEVLIPGLIEAFDSSGGKPSALAPAIETLRVWDYRVAVESVAMTLAHYYGTAYLKHRPRSEGESRMDAITFLGSKSAANERLEVFAATIAKLQADFGRWDIPWGEVNRYQRLNGEIKQPFDDSLPSVAVGMASGRWGALASFGGGREARTQRIYGTGGNSFVAVVEFGEKVKAKTILVGGQSSDPKSPHFDDQVQPYINSKFKEAAYYRADVERRAKFRYKPGDKARAQSKGSDSLKNQGV